MHLVRLYGGKLVKVKRYGNNYVLDDGTVVRVIDFDIPRDYFGRPYKLRYKNERELMRRGMNVFYQGWIYKIIDRLGSYVTIQSHNATITIECNVDDVHLASLDGDLLRCETVLQD